MSQDDGSGSKLLAIEGLKDQKAIKVAMDRQQAMDQGIRYGSRINREAMDHGAMIGAMGGYAIVQGVRDGSRINRTSDGSGSNERSDGYYKR